MEGKTMMKRDRIVFEHERFELTGYDVWMTAGEIACLFGVTIMKSAGRGFDYYKCSESFYNFLLA